MPTGRHLAPQNWLPWQRLLTEVHQSFSRRNFVIDGVNAIIKQLDRIQRLVCLYVTGAIMTMPTTAVEIVVGLTPVSLFIKQEDMLSHTV